MSSSTTSSNSSADILARTGSRYLGASESAESLETPITDVAINAVNNAVTRFQSINGKSRRGVSLYREKKEAVRKALEIIGEEFGYRTGEIRELKRALARKERMGELLNAAIHFDRRFHSYAAVIYLGHETHRGYTSRRSRVALTRSNVTGQSRVIRWVQAQSRERQSQSELAVTTFAKRGLITNLGSALGLDADRVRTVRRTARRLKSLRERIAYVREQLPAMSEPLVVAEIYRRCRYDG